jgi:hypothetical protein
MLVDPTLGRDNWERVLVPDDERPRNRRVIIDTERHELKARMVSEAFVETLNKRQFLETRCTPGSPDVEEGDMAWQFLARPPVPGEVRKVE